MVQRKWWRCSNHFYWASLQGNGLWKDMSPVTAGICLHLQELLLQGKGRLGFNPAINPHSNQFAKFVAQPLPLAQRLAYGYKLCYLLSLIKIVVSCDHIASPHKTPSGSLLPL